MLCTVPPDAFPVTRVGKEGKDGCQKVTSVDAGVSPRPLTGFGDRGAGPQPREAPRTIGGGTA